MAEAREERYANAKERKKSVILSVFFRLSYLGPKARAGEGMFVLHRRRKKKNACGKGSRLISSLNLPSGLDVGMQKTKKRGGEAKAEGPNGKEAKKKRKYNQESNSTSEEALVEKTENQTRA